MARSVAHTRGFGRHSWGVSNKNFLTGSSCDAPPGADAVLAWIAAHRHGLVTTPDLRRVELNAAAVAKRRARGRLHRVGQGVYALGHASPSQEARWLAAVLEAGEGAALWQRPSCGTSGAGV